MVKKTITYTDYDGNERTGDFYFNLSKPETMEMELEVAGGLTQRLKQIIDGQDTPELIKFFRHIILKAYGVKHPDGNRFEKSEELSKAFSETEAFSELYMELATDSKAAAAFMNGIVPQVVSPVSDKPELKQAPPAINTSPQ